MHPVQVEICSPTFDSSATKSENRETHQVLKFSSSIKDGIFLKVYKKPFELKKITFPEDNLPKEEFFGEEIPQLDTMSIDEHPRAMNDVPQSLDEENDTKPPILPPNSASQSVSSSLLFICPVICISALIGLALTRIKF